MSDDHGTEGLPADVVEMSAAVVSLLEELAESAFSSDPYARSVLARAVKAAREYRLCSHCGKWSPVSWWPAWIVARGWRKCPLCREERASMARQRAYSKATLEKYCPSMKASAVSCLYNLRGHELMALVNNAERYGEARSRLGLSVAPMERLLSRRGRPNAVSALREILLYSDREALAAMDDGGEYESDEDMSESFSRQSGEKCEAPSPDNIDLSTGEWEATAFFSDDDD